MTKKKMAPSKLVEDLTIYPRQTIDDNTVARYAAAYELGEELPPPTIDAESLRIVDGFHRIRGWKHAKGDEPMTVDVRRYATEQELTLAAVEQNAKHGKPYAAQDYLRVHRMLTEHGYSITDTALVLKITTTKLSRLIETRTATVSQVKITTAKATKQQPEPVEVSLKPALRHLAGQTLTPDQQTVNEYLSGAGQIYLARQLRLIVENDLTDITDDSVRYELATLRDRLIDLELPSLITT